MSSDMENTVIKLFIDAMELSGVSSPNKISNVLAIGLTETYSHMAPWHVIMGQSFGASITYQLDAALYFKLGNHKLLIWSSHLQQRVKRVFQRGRLKIKLQTEAKVPAKSLTRKPKAEEPKKSKKPKKPKS